MTALLELQDTIAAVAARVGPAVVGLGRGWGVGSGVVVAEGAVLTNAHVLRRAETTVTFADGRQETGQARGVDREGDLAVVAADTGDVAPIAWAPEDAQAGLGSVVFALANPGGRGLRVTAGSVSSAQRSFRGPRGRRIAGALEHTAPLPRGSSGGPLVDAESRLLGINSVRLDGGLILALAADPGARARVDALRAGQAPGRPRLGLAVAPAYVARRLRGAVGLPDEPGVLVRAVQDDGPAAAAGIERGDLIVAAGGTRVAGVDDLHSRLDAAGAGATLSLELVRGADRRQAEVLLGEARDD